MVAEGTQWQPATVIFTLGKNLQSHMLYLPQKVLNMEEVDIGVVSDT